eukprot:CAMPEP_0197615286 /NCGR_PEP_ID=MMETSP1326-20131121/59954_1 /TAXON_ID=1155430 /ORGANISM="Genus nov. species nov., Strain RCC2288" /LENGTH=407 /DNA_ID=CAMNT_0043184167 /DNA_START=153 /DNA_END=1374 /DNA_ORIENTATION=-
MASGAGVPARLLALLCSEDADVVPRSDELGDDAAVFIADVSGFSALERRAETEGLAVADSFAVIVNDVLGGVERLTWDLGGCVVHTAGDALICVFPPVEGRGPADAAERGGQQRSVAGLPAANTNNAGAGNAVGGSSPSCPSSAAGVPTRLLALLPVAPSADIVILPRADELGEEAAVFIADVSGFSALERRAETAGLADSFAELVNDVLGGVERLTWDLGGCVVHTAGDALICVFPPVDGHPDGAIALAEECARRVLHEFETVHRPREATFSVHGGIARGGLTVLHLGTPERRHLTVCGPALRSAAELVDKSRRGEVLSERAPGAAPSSLVVHFRPRSVVSPTSVVSTKSPPVLDLGAFGSRSRSGVGGRHRRAELEGGVGGGVGGGVSGFGGGTGGIGGIGGIGG